MFSELNILTNVDLAIRGHDIRIFIILRIIDHPFENTRFQFLQVKQPCLEIKDIPEWQYRHQVVNEHVTVSR